MKNKIILILTIIITSISFSYETSYVALENGTLISKNQDKEIRAIASLTKLMTAKVVLDAVDKGEISLNDKVLIDVNKVNIGGSSIPLLNNDSLTVEELLNASLIYSANNASICLGIYVGGNEEEFVKRMNIVARKLGMYDTKYYTSTGLPPKYTRKGLDVSTAYDQYLLSKEVIKDKRILNIVSKEYVKVKDLYFKSRNKILNQNGNIGLKTGYNVSARFNMIGLFDIKGNKLIAVTMGDETLGERFSSQLEISSKYIKSIKKIYSKDVDLKKIDLPKTFEKILRIRLENDFYYHKENVKSKLIIYQIDKNIKKGDKVGEFLIYDDINLIKKIDVIAISNSTKLTWFDRIKMFFSFKLFTKTK